MDRDELKQEITLTLDKITKLKKQISQVTDPREKKKLKQQLRELRNLQLWHIDQFENLKD